MKANAARYLLRFDDLCPTMSRSQWQRFLPVIAAFKLRPILAVVPHNQDPELAVAEPDAEFWTEMRKLQARGATIGLHGYRHLAGSLGRGLLPLYQSSEFAGAQPRTQQVWIRSGMEILRGHGLDPRIWVAPRHGLDENTLVALREEGITVLSDGFARRPFTRGGLTWIPQQLWAPLERPTGLWTICIHSNTAPDSLVCALEDFVRDHAEQFTSVERVLREMPAGKLTLPERLYGTSSVLRFRAKRGMRRLLLSR
jgi:hypothetical protein